MTTTAKIAAKGCKGTGITEEIAKRLHDNLGKTIVIIAEVTSEARSETKAGDESVTLSINNLEIAPEGTAADHVRDLNKLFHYERKLAEEGPTLDTDDGPAPKVADVLAAGAQHRPHPFLPVDASQDNSICDVCGSIEDAAIHDEQARTSGIADPFAVPDETDDELAYDEHDSDQDGDEDQPPAA